MAKRLEYDIVTDPSKGIAGLKQFSSAAKKAMADVDDSLDGTTTAAKKVAAALSGLADELETEMKGAATAADALGKALGPELAGRANVGQIVQDLKNMGLTFDQITADADTLAESLKKLDGVQMAGAKQGLQDIEDSTKRTKAGVDDIGKSADSSRGALANMIGNSAQDMGQFAGVTGSAGVAIGQMAEYMADAAFEGEGLGKVMGSFAKIAGPVAALALGTQVLNNYMTDNKEAAEQSAKSIDDWKTAIEGGGDVAAAFAADLAETGHIFLNLGQVSDDLSLKLRKQEENWTGLSGAWHAVFGGGGDLRDMVPLFDKANLSVQQFTKAVTGGAKGQEAWAAVVKDSNLSTDEQAQLLALLTQEQNNYADGLKKSNKFNKIFGSSVDDNTKAINDFIKAHKPMSDLPKTWDSVKEGAARMLAGLQPTASQLQAAAVVAEQYGITVEEAFGRAGDAAAAAQEDFKTSLDSTSQVLTDWGKSTEDAVLAIGNIQQALDDMTGTFPTMGRSLDAIAAAFALKDAPLKVAGEVRDISLAIGDLSEDMKGIKVGDVLAGSVKADKFLDAMDKLRPDIQTKISETFADPAGGAAAASQLANTYIDQIVKELGGKFSREQVAKMLGLDDLAATIKIAIDQKSLAEATTILELFANLPNTDPALVMQLRMDLSAGLITPDGVKELLDPILAKAGVTIPPKLLPPDPQSLATAKASADNFYARNPALIATETTDPNNMGNTLNAAQRELNRHPLTISTVFSPAVFGLHDAGGTTGRGGGIVGERRPEIVNGRYLVTSPTVVPPGTRVTSGARTARILRTRGTRGLRKYDSGGTVAGARTVNVNINAGVVGNRYDVMKAVQRAHLDKLRLFGERG